MSDEWQVGTADTALADPNEACRQAVRPYRAERPAPAALRLRVARLLGSPPPGG